MIVSPIDPRAIISGSRRRLGLALALRRMCRSVRLHGHKVASSVVNLGLSCLISGAGGVAPVLAFDQAKVVTPEQAAIEHLHAGESHAAARDWEAAAREFYQACQFDEHNMVAFYDLGVVLYKMHRYKKAEMAERRAIQLDPRNSDAHQQLAVILCEMGDLDGAERAARRAVELDGRNFGAKESLANIEKLKARRKEKLQLIGKPQEA